MGARRASPTYRQIEYAVSDGDADGVDADLSAARLERGRRPHDRRTVVGPLRDRQFPGVTVLQTAG